MYPWLNPEDRISGKSRVKKDTGTEVLNGHEKQILKPPERQVKGDLPVTEQINH